MSVTCVVCDVFFETESDFADHKCAELREKMLRKAAGDAVARIGLYDSPKFGWGKLVRDGVVREIGARGGKEELRVLIIPELFAALKAKVVEEALEVLRAETPEQVARELGDVLEAMRAVADKGGIPWSDVLQHQEFKRVARGDFGGGFFLLEEDFPKGKVCPACNGDQLVAITAEEVERIGREAGLLPGAYKKPQGIHFAACSGCGGTGKAKP
jgi:predicted house-cleaning noncanonical NTP pyrophosphatase (MazG superfamily)